MALNCVEGFHKQQVQLMVPTYQLCVHKRVHLTITTARVTILSSCRVWWTFVAYVWIFMLGGLEKCMMLVFL